jgi:hypothetical protein
MSASRARGGVVSIIALGNNGETEVTAGELDYDVRRFLESL